MLSGQPINKKDEDIFERSNFADHIADLLILPENSPSITIALEGEWGTGKTSTINLISSCCGKSLSDQLAVISNLPAGRQAK
jgi:predicted KAP-like P-loop ATPase